MCLNILLVNLHSSRSHSTITVNIWIQNNATQVCFTFLLLNLHSSRSQMLHIREHPYLKERIAGVILYSYIFYFSQKNYRMQTLNITCCVQFVHNIPISICSSISAVYLVLHAIFPISLNLETSRNWTFFWVAVNLSAPNQKYPITFKHWNTCFTGYVRVCYRCAGARPIIRSPENKKWLTNVGYRFPLTSTIIPVG
jgi:succinate dehydrogenase hydrophobic anchor subunit